MIELDMREMGQEEIWERKKILRTICQCFEVVEIEFEKSKPKLTLAYNLFIFKILIKQFIKI